MNIWKLGGVMGKFCCAGGQKNNLKIVLLLTGLVGCALSVFAQPYGLSSRPPIGPFLNNALPKAAPAISTNWTAVVAFSNLFFTNAVGFTGIPGTNRVCVWEREGRVWSFANSSNTSQKTLVLDVHNQCQGWDDSGLLGVAFHPGFATNHYMFVYYTWVIPGTVVGDPNTRPPTFRQDYYHDRLSRVTLDANGVAIPGSELVFVDQKGGSVWHNGGGMFFHPVDGFLYYTDGDDDGDSNGQIINQNLLAGVFRIDVDKRGGNISHPIPRQPNNGTTANYYIPNNNPFVGQPGVLEEFFCLGLRSPHRMTYDPPTGRIYIGDVGSSAREEIDLVEPGESGLNFQWPDVEGDQGDLSPPYSGINRRPLLDYTHSDGLAVIGGYVYRGTEFAQELEGKYIFGDNVFRTVWALDESSTPPGKVALCTIPEGQGPNSGNDYTGLSSFGTDQNGEIYMCQMSSIGGQIYKLAHPATQPMDKPLPNLLSQTGAFGNLTNLTVVSGLIPYNVNSPLWSDGAVKTRWMALPTNTFIHFAPTGEWTFPNGSVFVKHFELPVNDSNPSLRRRLETRLLVRDTNGLVYGASYKWRADNSDADLVTSGISEDILINTSSGTRTQQWYYPGVQDCLSCHTPNSGGVLGVKTRQLNGSFTYAATGITDNQVRAWNHIGLFDTSVNEAGIPAYSKLVSVTNSSASLEDRFRSYIDANCAHCHRPAGVQAFFDARYDTPLASQGIINGLVQNFLGIESARVVKPGDTNGSILFQRVCSLGSIKMPPLARNVVDEDAVEVIAQWINSIPPITNSLTGSYADAVLASQPTAYWQLNEPTSPGYAKDSIGGNDGIIGSAITAGVAGPVSPLFPGFTTNNTGMRFQKQVDQSYLIMPALNLDTNTITITCWFYPDGYQDDFSGLVFSRDAGTVAGLHFGPWANQNELRFTWDNDQWSWASGLHAPTNQWCFAALVVQPNVGTIYLGANGTLLNAVRSAALVNQGFDGTLGVGWDPFGQDRIFNGVMDEVAVYDRALTPEQIQQLYMAAVSPPLRVSISQSGTNVVITWPYGTLQRADTPVGPWTDLSGTNAPYIIPPTAVQKFFRVKVK
jgi:uncharacterized repeat protein (TIGR03806 family)